jgi:hypothetical protein
MKGMGVEPEILVGNDPVRERFGIDDQLNKTIQLVHSKPKKNPVKLPLPPYPNRS